MPETRLISTTRSIRSALLYASASASDAATMCMVSVLTAALTCRLLQMMFRRSPVMMWKVQRENCTSRKEQVIITLLPSPFSFLYFFSFPFLTYACHLSHTHTFGVCVLGRARVGGRRAPHRKGGGHAHPRRARSHAYDMPIKVWLFAI